MSQCELCAELVADAARGSSLPNDEQPTVVGPQAHTDSLISTGYRRGDRVGRYVILEPLGRGAMGLVFTAYDPQLERAVALKVLRPEIDDAGPARAGSRLRREAQAAAKLRHPNVVTIYECGEVDGLSYIAMERIDGDNLRQWLRAGPRHWRDILAVFKQAGEGLAAAHRANILHRDFKPDNVLVDSRGRAKVVDFGLAKASDAPTPTLDPEAAQEDSEALSSEVLSGEVLSGEVLTRTGTILGTPAYMAPQQHLAQPVDARADQYAWCVALWEALHGSRPFVADTVRELGEHKRKMTLSSARQRVPRWLQAAMLRGLRPDPAQRFSSMDELLHQVDRRPKMRRRLALGVAGAAVLTMIGAGAFLSGRAQRVASVCDTSGLDRVWSADRAEALRRAFEQSSVAYAGPTADVVVRELDAWAQRWREAGLEVCEAQQTQQTQQAKQTQQTRAPEDSSVPERVALRRRCLDRKAQSAAALLTTLEDVDLKLIQRAPRMVAALPEPARCLRSATQLRRSLASSDDPERQRQLDEADALLVDAWALGQAARYVEARDLARNAVEQATALDAPKLHARALYQQGNATERLGEFDEAEALLRRATATSERAGLDLVAAEAMVTLVHVVGASGADADAAAWLAELARSKIERVGGAPKLSRQLENNLAAVAYTASDVEGALEHQRRSIELGATVYAEDSLELAINRDNLAALLLAAGLAQEAIEVGSASLAIVTRHLGPNHPQLAQMNGNLSSAFYIQGQYARALIHADESVRLLEQAGVETPFLAHAHNNRGNILSQIDRLDEARKALDRALEIHERLHGEEHPNVAMALDNLGSIERELGEATTAKPRHERALAIRSLAGEDNPRLFYSYSGLGLAELELGEYEAAREHLEAAVQAYERGLADGIAKGEAQLGLVRALAALDEKVRARELASAARAELGEGPEVAELVAALDAWLTEP